MSGILWLLVSLQDPVQQQIDESLRQFEAAGEVEEALTLLSSQLVALGARAAGPIARRLADDLRDGIASAAVPAYIDALNGRPDALDPLRAAFRDAATSAAGRIELADVLFQLNDALTWRGGLTSIAADRKAAPADRLRSIEVLTEAGDPGAANLLRALTAALPQFDPGSQRDVVDFLIALDTPLARELLRSIAGDGRLPAALRAAALSRPAARATPEDPRELVIGPAPPRAVAPVARSVVKKRETATATFLTLPTILAGGGTLVLLVLLLVEVLRKG